MNKNRADADSPKKYTNKRSVNKDFSSARQKKDGEGKKFSSFQKGNSRNSGDFSPRKRDFSVSGKSGEYGNADRRCKTQKYSDGDSSADYKEKRYTHNDEKRNRKYNSDRPFSASRGKSVKDKRSEVQGERKVREQKSIINPELHFSDLLLSMAVQHGYLEEQDIISPADSLAAMDYPLELELKKMALQAYWKACGLPELPNEIIPSPRFRNYRTTSKRKVSWNNGKLVFSMGYTKHRKGGYVLQQLESPLEADLHGELYAAIFELLQKKHYEPLAKVLNYCIIRGSYHKAAVILNIFRVKGEIVHKLKLFTEELKNTVPGIQSVFMFVDETRSDYYLESTRPVKSVAVKKLFGSDSLCIKYNDHKILYPPMVFSQVNESMIPVFVQTAMDLLDPKPSTRVLDLYCGYGLFSFAAADAGAGSVWGMELEGPAVTAAISNANYLYPNKNMKFFAEAVTPDSLEEVLPFDDREEYVILDPPRSGTADGVIQSIVDRKPRKVLHIFCGTDQIPNEMRIWLSSGYKIESVKVFDMFPGSPNLETMILLQRQNNRKDFV